MELINEKLFIRKMLYNYDVTTLDVVNNDISNNIVNNYTQKIYVINLEKNIVRKNYILTMMKKYGINFTLVIVKKIKEEQYNYFCKYNTNISIGELGCGLSHMWCLKDIVQNKYENAIIFEDDIIFHKKFTSRFYNIIKRQSYDFLLLGACDFHFSEINYKNVSNTDNLYRPHPKFDRVYGAHAIYYSLKGARYVLENKLKQFAFFDYNFNKIFSYFKNTSFICYPNLVVTEITTSDINHNYELFSKKERLFYTKCFVNFNFNHYHFIYLNLLDGSCIDKFSTYKDFICNLFKEKYPDKVNNIEKFIRRINFEFFTLEDIKNICNASVELDLQLELD
jgi:GR25 family glycosyltransferase involved in LPS biosynthesis